MEARNRLALSTPVCVSVRNNLPLQITKGHMKKLLWIALLIGLIMLGKRWLDGGSPLSLVEFEVKNPHASTSPLHAASQRFVEGINGAPAHVALFGCLH